MTSLDGLRALEQAASPGPWSYHAGTPEWTWHPHGVTGSVYAEGGERPVVAKPNVADALFIAAARNALPDLLDRVAAAEAERDALREALDLARAVKFEHHAVHEMRLGEDCVICAKPWVRAKLDRIAVLAASVPSGPAAGPTTSKETR